MAVRIPLFKNLSIKLNMWDRVWDYLLREMRLIRGAWLTFTISIILVTVMISVFLIFPLTEAWHQERLSYLNEKLQYSQNETDKSKNKITELNKEMSKLKDVLHELESESITGNGTEAISVNQQGIAVFDNDPDPPGYFNIPLLLIGPVVIRNNTNKDLVINVNLNIPTEIHLKTYKYSAVGEHSSNVKLAVTENFNKFIGNRTQEEYMFNPVKIAAKQTVKGFMIFSFLIDDKGLYEEIIFKDVNKVKLEFIDVFTGEPLIDPITAMSGGIIYNPKRKKL